MTHAISLKPRVCYILPEYYLATGSHFYYLYELLEQAAKRLNLLVIIEKTRTPSASIRFPAYRQIFLFPPLRALELSYVLVRERIRGTESFYVHYSFFGALTAWLVTALLGGRVFYWNCGMPWLYARPWFEESVFRFILRHTILVTGTKGIAEEYQRRYRLSSARVRVLPNWINCAWWLVPSGDSTVKEARDSVREKLIIADNKKVVLFVHRLSRRKGSHRILPVAEMVTKERSDVIFLIVGFGPDYEKLELEIVNLKLENGVILNGAVPNQEIPHYFAASDVFFMPSEEEGFPHVLLEAMASGVPYVASGVGGVREITPPELQEYVVPGEDTAAFSQKILRLLSLGPEERQRIIQAEQEWVKKYDINAVLPEFIQLFS